MDDVIEPKDEEDYIEKNRRRNYEENNHRRNEIANEEREKREREKREKEKREKEKREKEKKEKEKKEKEKREKEKKERKTINRLIYLYKNGFMPLEKEKKEEIKNYDIWEFENENSYLNYRPGFGFQAPKRQLPETEESYNPPLNDNNEKREGILRRIPRYDKLIDEELKVES